MSPKSETLLKAKNSRHPDLTGRRFGKLVVQKKRNVENPAPFFGNAGATAATCAKSQPTNKIQALPPAAAVHGGSRLFARVNAMED